MLSWNCSLAIAKLWHPSSCPGRCVCLPRSPHAKMKKHFPGLWFEDLHFHTAATFHAWRLQLEPPVWSRIFQMMGERQGWPQRLSAPPCSWVHRLFVPPHEMSECGGPRRGRIPSRACRPSMWSVLAWKGRHVGWLGRSVDKWPLTDFGVLFIGYFWGFLWKNYQI